MSMTNPGAQYTPSNGGTVDGGSVGGFTPPPPPSAGTSTTGTGSRVQPRNIKLKGPYSDQQRSAFPTWWGSDLTDVEIQVLLRAMSPKEAKALQQKLWQAGYYGDEAITEGVLPKYGVIGAEDLAAMKLFLDDAAGYSATESRTADELLDDRIASNAGLFQLADMGETVVVDPKVITTVDPATLEAAARSQAQNVLGRDLSPDEITAITSVVGAEDFQAQMAAAVAQQNSQITAAQARAQARKQMQGLAGETPMIEGGGPDSTAIQFGMNLAQSFGAQVTAGFLDPQRNDTGMVEFTEGLGVKIKLPTTRSSPIPVTHWSKEGGKAATPFNEAQEPHDVGVTDGAPVGEAVTSNALLKYLDANKGEGKLVKDWKRLDDGTVAVVFNDGARRPDASMIGVTANQDLGEYFTRAVKRDGDDAAYDWGQPSAQDTVRRGAYGFTDRQYRELAKEVWVSPDDHSAQAQDRVAKAYAKKLYDRYGDWEKVAQAWLSSPETVDRILANGDGANAWQRQGYDVVKHMGDEVISRMSELKRGTAPVPLGQTLADGAGSAGVNIVGGGVSVVPGVDPSTRAALEVERQHAAEAQGYGTISAYDKFSQMLNGE